MISDKLPSNHVGDCYFKDDYNGKIRINKDRIDGKSSIEIAATLIHETLHAYIHAYLYAKDKTIGKTTYDEAFKKYSETEMITDQTSDQDHLFMANEHVNLLAKELQRLHKEQDSYTRYWKYVGITDKSERGLLYEAIAWVGLEKTRAYQEDLSTEYKNKMKNIFSKNKESLPISWKCD